MTLSGKIYVLIETFLLLDITTDKFISYERVPDDPAVSERRQYLMVQKVLSFTDIHSPNVPLESIYSEDSPLITSVMNKTYCGEVTVVSDDFLDGWYKHA